MKRNVYLILVGAALVVAVWLLVPSPRVDTAVPAGSQLVEIDGTMGGFSTREIRVKAGRPVTIRLTSVDTQYHTDGGGKHQWAVDELGLNIIAPPLRSKYVTFTPSKPGTYTFYCDICCGGRANPTMSGRLVVS